MYQQNCPHCKEEILPGADVCLHCGLVFQFEQRPVQSDAHLDLAIIEEMAVDGEKVDLCLRCKSPYYLEDSFCRECGQTFCSNCGKDTNEEDDFCRNCKFQLYFDCPICSFELAAGTIICPNCDALFPKQCPNCQTPIEPGIIHCLKCDHHLRIIKRQSARTVQQILINENVVIVAACPNCGKSLHMSEDGPPISCPKCATRLCQGCQLVLLKEEDICPRCGIVDSTDITKSKENSCPRCHETVSLGTDECPHCGQLLCPNCHKSVKEDDSFCSNCGVEFELVCPECNHLVEPWMEVCKNCGTIF